MLWSELAGYKKGNVVSFFGKEFNQIRCIESSDLEITGGDRFTHSFAVSGLRKDATNLIVIEIRMFNDKGHYCKNHCAFIEIRYIEKSNIFEASLVDWVPSSVDCIGVVDTEGFVKMRIDDSIFSTDPSCEDGIYFIGKENICCNYLAGRISVDEVVAAAEETQKEIDLQQRCDELERENVAISFDKTKLTQEIDEILSTMESIKRNWEEMAFWKNAAIQLRYAVNSSWFSKIYGCSRMNSGSRWISRRKKIKEALKLFPDVNK